MVLKITKKEFIEMWRDGRFRWSAIVVLLLLAVALAFGWKNFDTVKREREAAQSASRQTWLDQGERNPHSAAHFGVYAYRPRTPLSLLDPGLDNYAGNSIWVEAHYQNPARNRPIEDATALQRFGELTASGVLLLLFPLLIIFLTFDSFSGERENGTLRQIASLGVARSSVVFGKLLGVGSGLLVLLVPVLIVGLAALVFSSEEGSFVAKLPRLALMGVFYFAYFLAFLGLSLAASAATGSSRLALVVLLGFWVFACLIVPRWGSDVADAAYAVPTPQEFWERVDKDTKDGIDGHDPRDKRTKELEQRVLAEYGVEKREDLPINFGGIALQAGEEHGNQVYDKHYGELEQTHRAQERAQNLFGLISPFVPMRALSMGLAGSDLRHHQHFVGEVEQYRRVLNKMLNDDLAYNSNPKTAATYRVGREFWERTPDLEYSPPGTGWVLGYQALSIFLLLLWGVGSIAAAIFAANRMRVV